MFSSANDSGVNDTVNGSGGAASLGLAGGVGVGLDLEEPDDLGRDWDGVSDVVGSDPSFRAKEPVPIPQLGNLRSWRKRWQQRELAAAQLGEAIPWSGGAGEGSWTADTRGNRAVWIRDYLCGSGPEAMLFYGAEEVNNTSGAERCRRWAEKYGRVDVWWERGAVRSLFVTHLYQATSGTSCLQASPLQSGFTHRSLAKTTPALPFFAWY